MIGFILALLSALPFKGEAIFVSSSLPNAECCTAIPDYLLDLKQISLPDCPNAFNPSIIRWNGSLLLCFRVYASSKSHAPHIGFCWLDEEFQPKGESFILKHTLYGASFFKPVGEDPRLIVGNDRIWISYNYTYGAVSRMALAELCWKDETFSLLPSEGLIYFDQQQPHRSEKNWVPFFVAGESLPFFSYSISPHRVFSKTGPNRCETKTLTEQNISWEWGEIRGGAPAQNIGDSYLSFFHSTQFIPRSDVIQGILRQYFVGAYLFSTKNPFELTHVSSHPLQIADYLPPSKNAEYSNCEGIYPGGFVFDKNYIWLAFGRYDHEMWIAKLDRAKLLDSLIHLSNQANP